MAPSFLNSDSSKSKLNWDRLKLFGKNSSLCVVERTPVENFANEVLGASYYAESPCLGYLRVLARLWKKNNQKRLEYLAKQREKAALYVVPPWKPNGSYVASLHDHSSAVNELGRLSFSALIFYAEEKSFSQPCFLSNFAIPYFHTQKVELHPWNSTTKTRFPKYFKSAKGLNDFSNVCC